LLENYQTLYKYKKNIFIAEISEIATYAFARSLDVLGYKPFWTMLSMKKYLHFDV